MNLVARAHAGAHIDEVPGTRASGGLVGGRNLVAQVRGEDHRGDRERPGWVAKGRSAIANAGRAIAKAGVGDRESYSAGAGPGAQGCCEIEPAEPGAPLHGGTPLRPAGAAARTTSPCCVGSFSLIETGSTGP